MGYKGDLLRNLNFFFRQILLFKSLLPRNSRSLNAVFQRSYSHISINLCTSCTPSLIPPLPSPQLHRSSSVASFASMTLLQKPHTYAGGRQFLRKGTHITWSHLLQDLHSTISEPSKIPLHLHCLSPGARNVLLYPGVDSVRVSSLNRVFMESPCV